MKKNKLITLVAAVSLFAGTGVSVITNNQVTYAAQKSNKSTAKVAQVQIKRGAVVYTYTAKDNKITSVKPYKYKNKKMYLKSAKADAIWSTKYKKTTYYYVKISNKARLLVRAKDTKRLNKVSIPSFTTYMNKIKAKVDSWNSQIDAAMPKKYTGTVATDVEYWTVDKDGKVSKAADKLTTGTKLTILFKSDDVLSSGDSKVTAYFALTSDNQEIILPAQAVTVDNNADSQIPDQNTYEDSVNKVNDLKQQADNDLNQFK